MAPAVCTPGSPEFNRMVADQAMFMLWCEFRDTPGWDDEVELADASEAVKAAVRRLRASGVLLERGELDRRRQARWPELRPPPEVVRDRDRARAAEEQVTNALTLKVCSRCGVTEQATGEFPAVGRQKLCARCDQEVREARAAKLRALANPGVPEGYKRCGGQCGQVKPLEDFTWWSRAEGRRGPRCRECDREHQRQRYARKTRQG